MQLEVIVEQVIPAIGPSDLCFHIVQDTCLYIVGSKC